VKPIRFWTRRSNEALTFSPLAALNADQRLFALKIAFLTAGLLAQQLRIAHAPPPAALVGFKVALDLRLAKASPWQPDSPFSGLPQRPGWSGFGEASRIGPG